MRAGRKYRKVPFIVLLYGLALVFLYKYSIRVKYIKKPLSIELDRCSCNRNLTTYNLNITRTFFNYTTCGRDAFFRGPHQKVIAFSFYGNSSYPEHLVRGFFEGNTKLDFKQIWSSSDLGSYFTSLKCHEDKMPPVHKVWIWSLDNPT